MSKKYFGTLRIGAVAGLLIGLGLAGCSDSPSPRRDCQPAVKEPLADRQTWDVLRLGGFRAGYSHTTVRREASADGEVLRIETVEHLRVKRSGQATQIETRLRSLQTPDGKLLSFEHEMKLGPTPTRTIGRVTGNRLMLETISQGMRESSSIGWSAEYGGPQAVELSLSAQPMQPGQRRTIRTLIPGLNQVHTVQLTAKDYEPVELPGGTQDLLRIDHVLRLPDGHAIETVCWADRQGEILKARSEIMGMALEQVRATKQLALKKTELPDLDLVADVMVKVDRPLPGAHRTRRVRYRVHLAGGDPARQFASGPTQQWKSIDPHTAELTVYAIRPGRSDGNPNAAAERPTDDDRQPNNTIQSDDGRIVSDAAAAAGSQTDPWQVALALEQYVHREVATQNFSFSHAFATAAEVAATREGDCSENAVFLAALARARKIPARAAVGLVYVEGRQSFGYHMWTEVYVEGRWIPLDATLGQGGIGAAHLKVAHSNLKGASAYSSFLPLLKIIGQLKIEVLEVE